jgi:UPF0755 protein
MDPRRRALWFYSLIAGLAFALPLAAILRLSLDLPVSDLASPRIVSIPARAPVREVGRILEREGVVPREWLFTLWVRLLGLGRHLRYGEYNFQGPQSIKSIIDILVSGKTALHRLTIPEGYTIRQIADLVQEAGIGTRDEIIRAAHDPAVLMRLGIPGSSAEGFLFPDTYLLPRDWPAGRVLGRMYERFKEVFDEDLRRKAAERGMTVLQAVTLASIIEKESGNPAERALVSAVFHNRLRRGIPLMADPVVIYGLDNFDGNLRKSDLQRPGPWNVYLNKGLPPGPIANPGVTALKAALSPANVDFLFFVSKNNGTHYFSTTLAEHNRAVNTYQRGH